MDNETLKNKLSEQLHKVFKEIEDRKSKALDFYNSDNFKNLLKSLEDIKPNISFSYDDLNRSLNINKEHFELFIDLLKYELTPEFIFYSETANLGEINQGYFFLDSHIEIKNNSIEFLLSNDKDEMKPVDFSKLQLQFDLIESPEIVFIKRLDNSQKIKSITRIANDDLFRLDRFIDCEGNEFNLLNGDSQEFIEYAKRKLV